jgi:hypothetical protein
MIETRGTVENYHCHATERLFSHIVKVRIVVSVSLTGLPI